MPPALGCPAAARLSSPAPAPTVVFGHVPTFWLPVSVICAIPVVAYVAAEPTGRRGFANSQRIFGDQPVLVEVGTAS